MKSSTFGMLLPLHVPVKANISRDNTFLTKTKTKTSTIRLLLLRNCNEPVGTTVLSLGYQFINLVTKTNSIDNDTGKQLMQRIKYR